MGTQIGSFFKSKYTGQQIENALDTFDSMAAVYDDTATYAVGDVVLYNNDLYICNTAASAETFDPTKWTQTTIAALAESIAQTEGASAGTTAAQAVIANAVQVTAQSFTDSEKAQARVNILAAKLPSKTVSNDPDNSSFTVEMSDAEDAPVASTVISGKTVAWNQIRAAFGAGTYYTSDTNWVNRTISTGEIDTAHIYYIRVRITSISSNAQVRLRYPSIAYLNAGVNELIVTAPNASIIGLQQMSSDGNSSNFVAPDNYLEAVDLSLIFTAAELTAIGTDVAKLKAAWLVKFGYPLPQYIPYDAGSIVSNNAVYQLTGRNIWDEVTLQGYYSATGSFVSNSNQLCSKNKSRVTPNATICIKIPVSAGTDPSVIEYDANGNFLRRVDAPRISPPATYCEYTTSADCCYVNFNFTSLYTGGGTYNNNICINLSDADFNGTYEAYFDGGSVTASSLNGIGTVIDEQNVEQGTVTRKIGTVDLGTLSFGLFSGTNVFYAIINDGWLSANVQGSNVGVCENYIAVSKSYDALKSGEFTLGSRNVSNSKGSIMIRDDSYSDAATFKTAMNGVYLAYELATPTTETVTSASLTTQEGYNILQPVSGDAQSGAVSVTYYRNLETVLSDIESRLSALE